MIGAGVNIFGYILPVKPQNKITAKELNNMSYFEVFNQLTNIALSRFRWINMPDTCRPEILEQTLFFYGKALFVKDEYLGYLHTPVTLPGPFNIYNESIIRQTEAFEYHKEYGIGNSVLIKANHCMFPDYISVWNYTPKIANCLRAIDVHTETLKRPFLITGPEKMRQTIATAINKISDNEIAVIGQKVDPDVEIKVLSLGTVSHLSDMWANVKNYYNQVYNTLGIKNSFKEKKERMITTEVEGENNAVRHMLESELSERKEACERINKMYGLNVDVEANEIDVFTDEMLEEYAARMGALTQNAQEDEDYVSSD